MTRAVVFAYHDVGARCLRVLRAHGVDVPLVVTHEDDPTEARWFTRVADVADDLGLHFVAPRDVNDPAIVREVAALAPDFVFSFYCRQMLKAPLLAAPRRGALNMHGSLLPKYRGRAPVNWAVLHGERQTGATLHYMSDKPDAGDIVAQHAVPILPDDTAADVFAKVTVAAEILLDAMLPALNAGTAPRLPNDTTAGSYFAGRRPEDGRIDWSLPATRIHDLVRAVAPPFPGARATVAGRPARLLRTRLLDAATAPDEPMLATRGAARGGAADASPRLIARCGGGGTLIVDVLEVDGLIATPESLQRRFGDAALPLG